MVSIYHELHEFSQIINMGKRIQKFNFYPSIKGSVNKIDAASIQISTKHPPRLKAGFSVRDNCLV